MLRKGPTYQASALTREASVCVLRWRSQHQEEANCKNTSQAPELSEARANPHKHARGCKARRIPCANRDRKRGDHSQGAVPMVRRVERAPECEG